jgi:choline-glycine betaine transporter
MTEEYQPKIALKVERILKQPLKVVEVVLSVVWLLGTHLLREPVGFEDWIGGFGSKTQSLLGSLYFMVAFAILVVLLYLMRSRRAVGSTQLADAEESEGNTDRAV